MKSTLQVLVLLSLVVPLAGCGREYPGPKRYPLSGKVSYDGVPIDMGTISFLPTDADGQRVSGGQILDGVYSFPEERGANAGTYRVEIRWAKKTGKKYFDSFSQQMEDERKEGLPPRFHEKSELTADVSDSQTAFDFHLKSK